MKKALTNLTLVLGGAASGKSTWAERTALQTGLNCVYVATAEALDPEMTEKIERHKRERGANWRTVESPLRAATAIGETLRHGEVAVVDCLTLWLTNQLLAEADIATETASLLKAFEAAPAPLIVVSNEVGLGIVPGDRLSRRFRNEQGRLNQRVAAVADTVVLMTAGLPLALKGSLP